MRLHELLPQCKYMDRIWRASWVRGQFVIIGNDSSKGLCVFSDGNDRFSLSTLQLSYDNIMALDWEKY